MNEFAGPPVDPAADLHADLDGAFGLPAWGSRLRVGTSMALNFGQPLPDKTQRGQWRLSIRYAAWRIETPDAVLAGSEDTREEMERAIAMLDGKVLIDADIDLPSLSATFFFADSTRLRTFCHSRDDDHWVLFRPDGKARVIGPNYSWTLMPE